MAWKKDLEKLKQSLGADAAPLKPAPPPKPKPAEFKPIEEEDAVFLSAMGHRPRPAAPVLPSAPAPAAARPEPPLEAPGPEFATAMGDLKGLVALRPSVPAVQPPKAPVPPPEPSPVPEPAPIVQPAPEPRAEEPRTAEPRLAEPPAAPQPVQINLAAGMAIEVDGALDLKGHDRNDAEERLKERIMDGNVLGWRTLHVVLGPSEDLRQMLLDLLKSPTGARIARFAQAPIPMGGSQAWILYFRTMVPPGEMNT